MNKGKRPGSRKKEVHLHTVLDVDMSENCVDEEKRCLRNEELSGYIYTRVGVFIFVCLRVRVLGGGLLSRVTR